MARLRLRVVALAGAALFAASAARAQTPGQLGIGVILGDPLGATGKYMINGRDAVQATLGISKNLTLTADYVWHGWKLTPQPKRGPLAVYLAGGVRLESQTDFDYGIRTMLGLSYWPKFATREAEFFLELGPTYRLNDEFRVRVDGGFGVRVYFAPSKS